MWEESGAWIKNAFKSFLSFLEIPLVVLDVNYIFCCLGWRSHTSACAQRQHGHKAAQRERAALLSEHSQGN